MAAAALVSRVADLHLDTRGPTQPLSTSRAVFQASASQTRHFRFLDLPPEIRRIIYEFTLFAKPGKHVKIRRRKKGVAPRLALFLVSYQLWLEASHVFYTNQVFRVFPVQDFQPLPTIRDLSRRYRKLVTSVELILGPGWTNPPKDWRVTSKLGLQDLIRVQTLQIFVELDPSHPSLAGFRVSEDYYTNFAGKLVHDILATMPAVKYVQIDTNPSVQTTGPLVSRLLQETAAANCLVRWGPWPKGRAADNVFVELLSKFEPWLKQKFPGRADSDLPFLTLDDHGNYVLSASSQPRPPEAGNDEYDDGGESQDEDTVHHPENQAPKESAEIPNPHTVEEKEGNQHGSAQ